MPPKYGNGVDSERRCARTDGELISAREAGNLVERFDAEPNGNISYTPMGGRKLTVFFLYWAQIIAHDMGKLDLIHLGGKEQRFFVDSSVKKTFLFIFFSK